MRTPLGTSRAQRDPSAASLRHKGKEARTHVSDPSRNVNGYHPIDKRTLTRAHDVRQIVRERALRTGRPHARRGTTRPARKRWHR